MENKDFVVFIITNGRPDNVVTLKTLKKGGYTGNIYFVVDDEDDTRAEYIKNFGVDKVKIFNKKKYADMVDEGNNFNNRRTTTHARNACFDISKKLGYKYFMVLDDDYTKFDYRINGTGNYPSGNFITRCRLDSIFNSLLNYYKSISAKSIAISQGGDWIGGFPGVWKFKRKCMNSFICSIDRPFKFIGQLNEDVNTYVTLGSIGDLFITIPFLSLTQKQTQGQKGGMTDAYLLNGTYVKSFSTVIMMPSSVKVSMMHTTNSRLHHSIKWVNTTPMIIDEKYKK
jgi:hypothetical protein